MDHPTQLSRAYLAQGGQIVDPWAIPIPPPRAPCSTCLVRLDFPVGCNTTFDITRRHYQSEAGTVVNKHTKKSPNLQENSVCDDLGRHSEKIDLILMRRKTTYNTCDEATERKTSGYPICHPWTQPCLGISHWEHWKKRNNHSPCHNHNDRIPNTIGKNTARYLKQSRATNIVTIHYKIARKNHRCERTRRQKKSIRKYVNADWNFTNPHHERSTLPWKPALSVRWTFRVERAFKLINLAKMVMKFLCFFWGVLCFVFQNYYY